MLKTNLNALLHMCSHTHEFLWLLERYGLDPYVSKFAIMREAGKHQHTSTRLHGVTSQPLFRNFLCAPQSFQTKTITAGKRKKKRRNLFPSPFHPATKKHLVVSIFTTSSLQSSVHTHASQSILAHGTLNKLQNVLRENYLSTISQM
jgi:hypothetical protein